MTAQDDIEFFHNCAVTAYAEAMAEGKHGDSEHVRRRAYHLYETHKRSEAPCPSLPPKTDDNSTSIPG